MSTPPEEPAILSSKMVGPARELQGLQGPGLVLDDRGDPAEDARVLAGEPG
jgi:hypothetical protein